VAWLLVALAGAAPNVVVILTDDQGYGDLSCHGNPHLQTPRLDRLKEESVAFDRFFVSPTCSPTRAAALCGRHEFRCGVSHTTVGRSLLQGGIPTVADHFAGAGYRTAVIGKWHLGDAHPCRPEDRGFGHVFVHGGGGIGQTPDYWGNGYFDPMIRTRGGWKKTEGYCTDVFFDEARRWIGERAAAREPFFLWLAPNVPHWPYLAPEGAEKKFLSAGLDAKTAVFYAMIEDLDRNVGRLLDGLGELGIAEDTVVVFFTDNGSAVPTWNAGMRGAKGSPDEGGVRVPCFIRWPGSIAGGRLIGEPAAHVDLLPTLVGLCGIEPGSTAGVEGADLAPVLLGRGKMPTGRTFFTHVGRWPGSDSPARHRAGKFSIRDDRWRLVGTRLHDMAEDPGQENDLFEKRPREAVRLLESYGMWWSEVLPVLRQPVRYRIGGERQAKVRLTCFDWWPSNECECHDAALRLWNQEQVKKVLASVKAGGAGLKGGLSGHWKLWAEQDGHYLVKMSKLPADAAVGERREMGMLKAGTVHVRVNRNEVRMELLEGASEVSIGIDLEPGPADLEAWFGGQIDGGGPLGAFFAEVSRVGERKAPVPKLEARPAEEK